MIRIPFSLIVALTLFSPQCYGLDITYSTANPFDGTRLEGEGLLIRGEIMPGDYERLLKFIGEDPERFWRSVGLTLASHGGDVKEALQIADFVRQTYTPVWVGQVTGSCVSSCFLIYSASPWRNAASGTLGIHRPYIHPDRMKFLAIKVAEHLHKSALAEARKYRKRNTNHTLLF